MATIGVGSGSYIRPYRNVDIRHFRVDASQTILLGTPLQLSTDADEGNRVKKTAADPTTDRGLVGIAAEAITTGASPTALDAIPVWLFTPESEFVVHVVDAQAIDNDDISVRYGIAEDVTNNIFRLDRTEITAIVFKVVGLLDAHGDTNGRVIVRPVQSEALYGAN